MIEIEQLYFINKFEGDLVNVLIRERAKIRSLMSKLWVEKNLRMSMLKFDYDAQLHRLKLIKIMLSQLIKTLTEDEFYG